MYQKKMPKCQKPDSNEFTAYNPHTIDLKNRDWPEVVQVISIDPGIRNLALRVESRGIRNNNVPIKTIVFEKLHIKEEDRKLVGNVDQLYFLITNFLDTYLNIFKNCHIMLIERQLPNNYRALRISQHIISYFLFHFKNITPSLPMIFEIDSKLKGKQLGYSKHLNERGLKQWSVEYATSLLTKRQDYVGLEVLQKHKKKADDHSDVTVMIEAFFSFQGWPLTTEVVSLKLIPSISKGTQTIKNVTASKSVKSLEPSKGVSSTNDKKVIPLSKSLKTMPPNPLLVSSHNLPVLPKLPSVVSVPTVSSVPSVPSVSQNKMTLKIVS
jgi:hypothetical protein